MNYVAPERDEETIADTGDIEHPLSNHKANIEE
jgi:hypothetical protein